MAKTDGFLERGDKVLYRDDLEFYIITAVFENTVWLRNPKTKKMMKAIPKEEVYK